MANGYVQRNPDGSYTAVVNGRPVGGTAGGVSQSAAENAFNANGGVSDAAPAAPAAGTPPPAAGGGLSDDHRNRLRIAGYGDWANPNLTEADYQRISSGAEAAGAATSSTTGSQFNKDAADAAAQAAYYMSLAAHNDDQLAFDKAKEAWYETYTQGQANNTNALDWLKLASSLSGPANAFNYAKLLTGTPGGLADIVRAAGGGYQLPAFGGGAAGNSPPLTIDSIIADLNKYNPNRAGGAAVPPASSVPGGYDTVNGVKTVAQMAAELKTAGWGGNSNDTAAVVAAYASTTGHTVTAQGTAPVATATPVAQPQAATNVAPSGATTQAPVTTTPAMPGIQPTPTASGYSTQQASVNPVPGIVANTASSTAPVGGDVTGGTSGIHIHIHPQAPYVPLGVPAEQTPTSMPVAGTIAPPRVNGVGTGPPAGVGPETGPTSLPTITGVPGIQAPLLRGNQLSPQNMALLDPGQLALLKSRYEHDPTNAWNFDDVMAEFKKSLGAYGGPVAGATGF